MMATKSRFGKVLKHCFVLTAPNMALESEASFPFALSCLALNVNQVVIPHSSLFVRFPAHRTYFENPHPNVDQQRKTTNKPGREKEAKRGSKT